MRGMTSSIIIVGIDTEGELIIGFHIFSSSTSLASPLNRRLVFFLKDAGTEVIGVIFIYVVYLVCLPWVVASIMCRGRVCGIEVLYIVFC